MRTAIELMNCSHEISALANVFEGIISPHYPAASSKGFGHSVDNRNHHSFIKNIREEAFRIYAESLYFKAESLMELQARWRLIQDTARIFGLDSVAVARSARALSSDAYRLSRLNR